MNWTDHIYNKKQTQQGSKKEQPAAAALPFTSTLNYKFSEDQTIPKNLQKNVFSKNS